MPEDIKLDNVEYNTRGGADAEDMPKWSSNKTNIRAYHFPFCCTGIVLTKLGGSSTAFGGNKQLSEGELTKEVEAWVDYFTIGDGRIHKKQFISVCTTNAQTQANKVLRELGFTKSRWMANHKYAGTKLATWTLPIGHIKKVGV
tara:strand:+ start:390 stop:821 length:432 start_codon:yes stop_codon:yes gene_type:complete